MPRLAEYPAETSIPVIYLAALIVIATLVAMASGRVPPRLALATGIVVAGLTEVVPVSVLTSGLSNGGVITIGAMLVIAKGVVKTGIVSRTTWLLLATVTTAQQALRRLILPIGVMSALINTTPIVAMLIPATREVEQTRGVPAREVLLPIAHVTTLAGSMTLIGTSSNLLIAGIASEYGVHMSMFSFLPVALPVAIAGAIVIYLTAPTLHAEADAEQEVTFRWRIEIPVGSHAIVRGRTAAALGIAQAREFMLAEIDRGEERLSPDARIESGDTLVFKGTEDGLATLWGNPAFGLRPRKLFSVAIGSTSGGTLHELERSGGIRVIAARTELPLSQTALVPGDTCFVTGDSEHVFEDVGTIALWQEMVGRSPNPAKTWVAVAILVGVIVSATFGLAPVELAAMGGAILMVLTGILTPRSAVRALDWNVLFIMAGSVGLGGIVVESGIAGRIADSVRWLAGGEAFLIVIVLVVCTAVLTNLVTNAAAASILTPVGLGLATDANLNPVIVLAVIGTCISLTFINPFSHQSNLMVMQPGGYTTATFIRFGIPLAIIAMITAVLAAEFFLQ